MTEIKDSILDTVGETPLVRLSRIASGLRAADRRQDRVLQPRRLDQGPRGDAHGRGRRARRPPAPGRDDHRADLRQHRHRPGDRGPAEGLSRDRGHAGQDVAREDRPAARLRGGGRGVPDRRLARVAAGLLPGRRPPDEGDPGRVPAQPVREPGQPGDALPHDRPRAVAPVGREAHALRGRRRHRRDDHRHRQVPQGAEPRRSRSSAPTRSARSTPTRKSTRTWSRAWGRTSGRRRTTRPSSIAT